jgi:hypothetical protein
MKHLSRTPKQSPRFQLIGMTKGLGASAVSGQCEVPKDGRLAALGGWDSLSRSELFEVRQTGNVGRFGRLGRWKNFEMLDRTDNLGG